MGLAIHSVSSFPFASGTAMYNLQQGTVQIEIVFHQLTTSNFSWAGWLHYLHIQNNRNKNNSTT